MSTLPIRNSFNRSRSPLIFVILVLVSSLSFACARPATYADASNVLPASEAVSDAVDVNSATREDLEKIPHIGPELAERIVAFRETYGPFTRPEQLLLVRGISEKRFREIRPLVRAH